MTLPDRDALASYGGALNNYFPVEDPTTDRDAAAANQAYASTAAMTRTAVVAWARLVTSATVPTLAATNPNDGTWPFIPANTPTPLRTGAGVFTLTYPATVSDELGVSHTLNFRAASAKVVGATCAHAQADVTAPNVVTVYTFNAAGAANDIAGTTVLVEIR